MVEQRLTLLYTANLLGRLDWLPRLFSLIQQVREADSPSLLIDLGQSCHPDAAVCAATEGRAALLVFDAMGYDGACLTAAECHQMGDAALAKLRSSVQMALCGSQVGSPVDSGAGGMPMFINWQRGAFQVSLEPAGDGLPLEAPTGAQVTIRPDFEAMANRWDPATRILWLAAPSGDMVGKASFGISPVPSDQELTMHFEKYSLTADHQPDSTVAAAVDFVKEEARLYRRYAARQQAHDMGGMT